jgi:hypothetical protein
MCLGYGQRVAPPGPLGVRDARASTFTLALLFAVALHLPFTPLPFVLSWLRVYLQRDASAWDYEDDRVVIPITLFEAPAEPSPGTMEPSPSPTSPSSGASETTGARDAGIADAHDDAVSDAGTRDGNIAADAKPPKVASAEARARLDDGGSAATATASAAEAGPLAREGSGGDGGGLGVRDPLTLVVGLRRAVTGQPNVSVLLWFSTIRDHPLGALVGGLLGCIPQWHDFLGEVVDPLQDLDGLYIFGPQMRNTSKLTIMALSKMDDGKLETVFGVLARRSGGSALSAPPGMRAVKFRADRADRVALTHPRSMIIVTPPDAFEHFRDITGPLSFPPGKGRALSVTVVTPWRPARELGLRLPETLRAASFDVSAASDGGVNIAVELDDESSDAAAAHAAEINNQVRGLGGPFLSDLEFVPESNRLTAETHLSRLSGAILLGYFRPMLCPFGLDGGRGGH